MKYELHIPGEPITKARPRVTKGGFSYTPAKTKNYETFVRELFFTQHGQPLMEGALKAGIIAYFPIPRSATKKLKAQMASERYPHTKNKDCDNIAKSILDSLNGIAYEDDKQIAFLEVSKYYSEQPRVMVVIEKIGCTE